MKELDISHAALIDEKMSFSMWTGRVSEYFVQKKQIKSVVIFGIEVTLVFVIHNMNLEIGTCLRVSNCHRLSPQ